MEIPKGLLLKNTQAVIRVDYPEMIERLGKPAPAVAVARQLCQYFNYGRDGAVKVHVPGYGDFLIGDGGWCLDGYE